MGLLLRLVAAHLFIFCVCVLTVFVADEARSLKAYGELPENAKINETDTYGEMGDEGIGFEFDEDRDSDSEDEADGTGKKEIDIDDI